MRECYHPKRNKHFRGHQEVKYQDDEMRNEFHKLETDIQVHISQLEEKLAQLGWVLEVVDIQLDFTPSQVIIRIAK